MSDLILNLSQNSATRKLMGLVGIPTPQILERVNGPCLKHPLEGRLISSGSLGELALDEIIQSLGAKHHELNPDSADRVHGLIFDATQVATVSDLKHVYNFLKPRVRKLNRCGRIVLISRASKEGESLGEISVRHALIGFCKSLSKEVGRRGSTANMITVSQGVDHLIEGPLRFFLSQRSAFVTGQSVHVSGGTADAKWSQALVGKTALITGAAQGIGEATARRLSQEGARVLILDIPSEVDKLSALAHELNAVSLPLDITDPTASNQILAASGGVGLDIVIHNAGITRDKTLANMSEKQWDQTLDVNLNSVLKVTETLINQRGINPGGRIVLVSSIAGIAGNLGQTNYAASKSGIIGLTHALSKTLYRQGIACNAVAPGFIETRMTRAIPLGIRLAGRRLSNLSQGGLPVDIADAITFLSSPGAGGLHGNVLRVCGGNLLGA